MTARGGIYGDHHGDGTPVARIADVATKSLANENPALRLALFDARDKLRHYRDAHGGKYVGGKEYAALMRQIDEALRL